MSSPSFASPPSQSISSPSNHEILSRGEAQGPRRGQILGSMMHDSHMKTSSRATSRDLNLRPDGQTWQSSNLNMGLGGPVLQLPTDISMGSESPSSISTNVGNPLMQLSPAFEHRPARPSSQSASTHLRTRSQTENLVQENAQLRKELEDLRAERDQSQDACDNMLTELMTTQESLEDAQVAIAGKESELAALREQLAKFSAEPPGSGLLRNEERELRDLRLKCSRLQVEGKRKEEQLNQAKADILGIQASQSAHGSLNLDASKAQEQILAAEERATQATSLYEAAQTQVDTYVQQLIDWKNAYDGLQASYNDLQRSHTEISRVAQETRSKVDNQAVHQLQASHAALNDAQQMTEFWKQNSEKLSKKNKEVTEQIRKLHDALNSKSSEVDQQKSMIQSLQFQMG